MNKFKRGLQQSMIGIIGGIVVSTIMSALTSDGLIPTYFVWLFVLVGIAGNIVTIDSNRLAGTVFTIGWLIGGLILMDVLGTVDYIIYIMVPILILLYRAYVAIKPFIQRN